MGTVKTVTLVHSKLKAAWHLRSHVRGQSLLEVALLFPILLILLSGLIEFGFFLNEYLTIQDAIRNAARFSSDSDYLTVDSAAVGSLCSSSFPQRSCCNVTLEIYRQTACLVTQELTLSAPDITLNCLEPGPNNTCIYGVLDPFNGEDDQRDDILVSVFSVEQGGASRVKRFGGADGWSYAQNYAGYGVRNQVSRFNETTILNRLNAGAPNTGYILVEILYSYNQKLKLPWITAFVADPMVVHAYSIMPLVSAEPTPTPLP
jgi:hypothetical protein